MALFLVFDNTTLTPQINLAPQCKFALRKENKVLNELTNKTKILLEWIQAEKNYWISGMEW